MRKNVLSGHILIIFFSLIVLPQYCSSQDITYIYIDQQKINYERAIMAINYVLSEESERNWEFGDCPMQVLREDFLGSHFKLIHTEKAGFLDCDGPTFLNIYDNGLYINHTGDREYKCYIRNFNLTYSGLKSGTMKQDIIEQFGKPMIQSKSVLIYGCDLNIDPYKDKDENYEIREVNKNDPNNYLLDFFFIFEYSRLIAVVHIVDHYCY